ncbi:MAG TPA: hypothetical protein VFR87_12260 [Nocardioidaceae bacterium]|nr:hypothetical protein [Nocardioidaceae bacterium]
MRGLHRVAPSLLPTLATLAALSGCGGDGSDRARAQDLGGPAPTPSPVPAEPMDRLEEPVAERLAPRLDKEGLTLEYVDCPAWSGDVPDHVRCEGYVDGVVGEVEVRLTRGERGVVEFDAWLGEGIVATSRLVTRLEHEGWHAVDCGATPAYPARAGLRITCRVHEGGTASYVVATVTDRRGEVQIEEY